MIVKQLYRCTMHFTMDFNFNFFLTTHPNPSLCLGAQTLINNICVGLILIKYFFCVQLKYKILLDIFNW